MFLRTLKLEISHAVEVAHIMEDELSVLQADEGAVSTALITLVDKKIQTQAHKARGLNTVERRRVAALLQVTQDRRAHVESIATSSS